MTKTLFPIAITRALTITGATPGTLYMKARSSAGDRKCWRTAGRSVEDALKQTKSGDEIWVAAGTYKLTDRPATFQLKTAVGLRSGFVGNELNRSQCDWQTAG